MNVRDTLRSADPARRSSGPDEPDERLLREILGSDGPASTGPRKAAGSGGRRDWKPVIATAVVAVVVLVGTVLAIRVVPTGSPAPAVSPTADPSVDGALRARVDAKLAEAARSARLDPDLGTQTWSDAARGAQGDMIDLTGTTLYFAAACTGGGSVTIQIGSLLDTTLDCTTTALIGPIDLSAVAAKAKKGIGLDVTASAGRPAYAAKAVAVPSSEVTTTAGVEVGGRTLLVYPASGAGGDQALLRGRLTQNAAGCIAVGDQVLVAPSNTVLLPDGSLRIGDERLMVGSTVSLGGGTAASIPVGSPCRAATGEYFVVSDSPQPQRG